MIEMTWRTIKKVQKQQNEKYIEAVLQNDIDFVIIINHAYADREFFDVCKMKNLKVFLYRKLQVEIEHFSNQ